MKLYKLILGIFLLYSHTFLIADHWKVFIYMDASDDMSDMAIKNLTDILAAKPNNNVEIVVQVHVYDNVGFRYRIKENQLCFESVCRVSGCSKKDFITAAEWALVDASPDDKIMIVLWDHGWGILDPVWNDASEKWEASEDRYGNASQLKRSLVCAEEHAKYHKGFIFSREPRTYLTNQDLTESLSFIKDGILGGRTIDVLAFDTCMGSMFEVGYQTAPYASYLVGSQSCSLRDGFNYEGIVASLNKGVTPRALACAMVEAFHAYYAKHDFSGIYTHAAIDLTHVGRVRALLDDAVQKILLVPAAKSAFAVAQEQALRFCLYPMYTDLVSFLQILDNQLSFDVPEEREAKEALQKVYPAVADMVIAHCCGIKSTGRTHGISMYVPWGTIDDSYKRTSFARDSLWVDLLHHMRDSNASECHVLCSV